MLRRTLLPGVLVLAMVFAARVALAVQASGAGAAALPKTDAPRFEALGIDRRFRAEIVTEVLQDQVGFLWVGTREGLFLYDGQRFRHFQHEVQDPDSISSNGIRGLFEDSRGRLWINTISAGLNLLDRGTWRFRRWRHDDADPQSLVHDGVFMLEEADRGRLWVGTQAGLDLFDPETGKFERQVLATGGEFVIALLRDDEDRLWVGTLDQGLFRQNATRDGFDPILAQGRTGSLDVFSVMQDARGRVWVGTREDLYRYDPASDRLVDSGLRPEPMQDVANFTTMEPDPDGGLWVGTFGTGLYYVDPEPRALREVELGPDVRGVRHVDGGALRVGHDGSLFVGTFGAGLFHHRPGALQLRTWRERSDGQPGLEFEDVYALLADADGRILAGSFGGGLDAIDPVGVEVSALELPADEETRARLTGILHAIRASDGALWAVTSEGAYRWHRERGEFRFFRPELAAGPSANPGYSYALLEDREGRIWVGSGGGGLYRYRPRSGDFAEYRPEAGNPRSLSGDFVTAMIQDRRGRLWVGTRSSGISICRLLAADEGAGERLDCERVGSGPGPRTVSHDHISSLLEAGDGAIWVGTGGGGLNRIRLDAAGAPAEVERWARDDGLVDDNVMALVQAPDGALWLSTHGGLSRFDPGSGRFDNLTQVDGLPTAVFNPKAALLHEGRLYFGSAKGVVSLDPAQPLLRGTPPPTVIAGVSGLAADELPARPAWMLDALQVPWRRPFSLEFAVLGYGGGQPEFQYRLGEGEAWTSLGDRGLLTLHALAPGLHRLEVRGRMAGSAWTQARPLQLDIVPPWWRRTWVQAAGLLALLALLLGGFWWRVRELEVRNRELQRVHTLREQALAEANTSRDRLEEAFASLRRLTMRLEAAKEQERKHIARELHDEFGQALTAAKINLRLALRDVGREGAETRIADTIALVEQLIGQVRALSLDLRPPLLDELGLLPALDGYLKAVSERSGIPIRTRLPERLPRLGPERDIAVFRIVQEAVTNALRHAGAARLQVSLDAEPGGVRIGVEDDGHGFDPLAVQAEGSGGFGLFGMRERVNDLGGDWRLASAPGAGTTIEAFVPARGSQREAAGEVADARDPG